MAVEVLTGDGEEDDPSFGFSYPYSRESQWYTVGQRWCLGPWFVHDLFLSH